MRWKSSLLKPFAKKMRDGIEKNAKTAVADQEGLLNSLVQRAQNTTYGQDHSFKTIKTHSDFTNQVKLNDYEGLRPYVDLIKKGQPDVLWPGLPAYFAKTSGTTSGVKYIPITKDSVPNHINTARNALFSVCHKANILEVFDGKVIFLSGSPTLDSVGGIPTGRLSGIVNHKIPAWLKSNQLPSLTTNCIEDWEEKLEHIVTETVNQDMRLISGIPPWVQMYYESLLETTGKDRIIDIFPHLQIFVYGGVNFEPYRKKMEEMIGKKLITLETYPASEGFIAFQDQVENEGLLLNTNSGIFFEFVPASEAFLEKPPRLTLKDVELDTDYAVIINSNAGLWGYNIGDTVRFVSLDPYRVIVSGRLKHFISAFGEHVIGKEVDEAAKILTETLGLHIVELTVAPQVNPKEGGLPYHEWLIEFDNPIHDIKNVETILEREMIRQNIYYKDLINGNILRPLKVTLMKPNAFRNYMKDNGKLGGQNKVPRLSNDRKIADQLDDYISN